MKFIFLLLVSVFATPVSLECSSTRLKVGAVIMNFPNIKADPKDGVLVKISGATLNVTAPSTYFYALRVYDATVLKTSCSWLIPTANCTQQNQIITYLPATGDSCIVQLDGPPTQVELGYANDGPPVSIIAYQGVVSLKS